MEFVRTSRGQIPPGRRPVEGGYEENGWHAVVTKPAKPNSSKYFTGSKLYHGIATVNGVQVPGKTGLHLYVSISYCLYLPINRIVLSSAVVVMFPLLEGNMSFMKTTISCKSYYRFYAALFMTSFI